MDYPKAVIDTKNKITGTINLDYNKLVIIPGIPFSTYIEVRETGNLADRALYLDRNKFDWVLVIDNEESLCLVPIKKN